MLPVLVLPNRQRRILWGQAALIILLVWLLAFDSPPGEVSITTGRVGVWGTKPILSHYLLNPEILKELDQTLGYSHKEIQVLYRIALQEFEQLEALERESIQIIQDRRLSIDQIRENVANIDYNQHMLSVVNASEVALKGALEPGKINDFIRWIENKWRSEQHFQLEKQIVYNFDLYFSQLFQSSYPRSFEVYATRYDAGGAYYVALPDKCLKFANGGAMRCSDGYEYGQNYSVAISYNGKTVYATVGEAGPWNVDDNYWSTLSDPQPRRMFADLPLGVPAAQAAYFNGYNGGLDQFGRVVKSPVAIDISYAVAEDLDLLSGNNKVTVSFLWTEGWDSGQKTDGSGSEPGDTPAISFAVSTPNPDGSIIHEVQQGQTLIGIANTYDVELNEILALNGLSMDAILLPGDKIVVRTADPPSETTPTSDRESTTPVAIATASPTSNSTVTLKSALAPTLVTPAFVDQAGEISSSNIEPILVVSHADMDGYNFFNLIRASVERNCQSTVAFTRLRSRASAWASSVKADRSGI